MMCYGRDVATREIALGVGNQQTCLHAYKQRPSRQQSITLPTAPSPITTHLTVLTSMIPGMTQHNQHQFGLQLFSIGRFDQPHMGVCHAWHAQQITQAILMCRDGYNYVDPLQDGPSFSRGLAIYSPAS